MSYKYKEILWTVPQEDVLVGVPVGYEVELSLEPLFHKTCYKLTTNEEIKGVISGEFYYSLDNGENWIDYPLGEQGKAFYSAYKMKLVVNAGELNDVFASKNGIIYKIYAQGNGVSETYTVGSFNGTSLSLDIRNNDVYLTGQNKTAYKVDSSPILKSADNSINLLEEPLGIAVDGTRNSMWQINRNRVYLKDLEGNEIFNVDLPYEIDTEHSSSSSSELYSSFSSSSSSSSSNTACACDSWEGHIRSYSEGGGCGNTYTGKSDFRIGTYNTLYSKDLYSYCELKVSANYIGSSGRWRVYVYDKDDALMASGAGVAGYSERANPVGLYDSSMALWGIFRPFNVDIPLSGLIGACDIVLADCDTASSSSSSSSSLDSSSSSSSSSSLDSSSSSSFDSSSSSS